VELAFLAIGWLIFLMPQASRGQSEGEASEQMVSAAIDTTLQAGDADAVEPRRKLVKWNEYDGPVSTFRFGFGFLLDYSTYNQDEESAQQIKMSPPDVGVRDFRLLFKGRFKTERPISWTLGYMWDGADEQWRFRQTGFQIGVPELSGRFFLGRTKEGYSNIKVMVGYHGWTIERSPALDAFVPILADGIKYMGYYERPRIFLQLGGYADWLAEEEKFATADEQFVWRLGGHPILSKDGGRLLHVAVMGREWKPDDGKVQVRSRPGAYLAPYFVDTGKFSSDHARTTGVEAFYRVGPWLMGSEYNWQTVDDADQGGSALFHAGDAVVAWNITGETRPYNVPGAFFEAVSPNRTVFENGPGGWEAVLHMSYTDFDSGRFHGGKLWRLTPMVNWHMSDNLRTEFVYGYSVLDRFELEGGTHFFQMRLQITL
jgi:phosphate-selective porin OprO/OprP